MVELSKAQKLRYLEAVTEMLMREVHEFQEKYDLLKAEAGDTPLPKAVTEWFEHRLADCTHSIEEARKQWTSTNTGVSLKDPYFEFTSGGKATWTNKRRRNEELI